MKSDFKKWMLITLIPATAFLFGCKTAPTPEVRPKPSLSAEQEQLLGEILEILDTTIADADQKIEEKKDPTSPLKWLADDLRKIREYVKSVEAGETLYDESKMKALSDSVRSIRINIENPVEKILETDVSFGLGKYLISDLSEKGKKALQDFTVEVIGSLVEKQRRAFPGRMPVIIVKTVGYADATPPGPRLASELRKGIRGGIPSDPVEARKILNTELSRRRAKTIGEYVKMQLHSRLDESRIKIDEPVIYGLGEMTPYPEKSIAPAYRTKDKRRRICKIHGIVFIDGQ